MDGAAVVAGQLGRVPRGSWRVGARCSFGYPVVIVTAPVTVGGEPFPTLYYLTCPYLVERISALESAGEVEAWRERLAGDAHLASRLLAADATYRIARATEGDGVDPTPDVGIAGQRDALATKCLRAHVATFLGGISDPVGEGVLAGIARECADRRCEGLT